MTSELLSISDLTFEVRRSSRRHTIGITVDRDGELIVHAPDDCPTETLATVVREKQFWVYTKLAAKALLAWPHREPEYVPGAGFAYLGRWYRLKFVDAPEGASDRTEAALRLFQGRFQLHRTAQDQATDLFREWYTAHAQQWLQPAVAAWSSRLDVTPQRIIIRELGYRWASCGHSGVLHFHWRAIQLPPRIIEYLVAHELVHLLEPRHGAAFWQQLERLMPDCEQRKQWLAERGGQY